MNVNFPIFFRLFCKKVVVSYTYLFAREINVRPARVDPLAHARRLNAALCMTALCLLEWES